MKQLTCLTIVACATLALAFTALGGPESLPSGKEMKQVAPAPAPECDFTWTGFYVGANFGYGWGNADTDFDPLPDAATFVDLEPTSLNPDPDGFIGGGQIGFNWQWNKWLVLGIESDFQGTDMEGDETRSPIQDIFNAGLNSPDSFLAAHERMQWFGSTRGRIGFAPWCRVLLYATGGVAYGNVDYSANTNFQNGVTYPVSFTQTEVGWTVGGGFEYAIGHHWTVKAEYLYYDLGNEGRTQNQLFFGAPQGPPFFVHYNFETSGNIVRGGLNFKF
ncbi:MAG TPA: outer membrane beta-barrel protein [Chthoniobacterales bacterium]|nr:outer membrane beta-barrel protein [Chthoniobacterales bacterium]